MAIITVSMITSILVIIGIGFCYFRKRYSRRRLQYIPIEMNNLQFASMFYVSYITIFLYFSVYIPIQKFSLFFFNDFVQKMQNSKNAFTNSSIDHQKLRFRKIHYQSFHPSFSTGPLRHSRRHPKIIVECALKLWVCKMDVCCLALNC